MSKSLKGLFSGENAGFKEKALCPEQSGVLFQVMCGMAHIAAAARKFSLSLCVTTNVGVIDYPVLMEMFGLKNMTQRQSEHQGWVEAELKQDRAVRERLWLDSIAVGSEGFAQEVKAKLGMRAKIRQIEEQEGRHVVGEPVAAYTYSFEVKNSGLSNCRPLILKEG